MFRLAVQQSAAHAARHPAAAAAYRLAARPAAAAALRPASAAAAAVPQHPQQWSRCFSSPANPASAAASEAPEIPEDGPDSHDDFKPQLKGAAARPGGTAATNGPATSLEDAKRIIEADIKEHDVFLYMKGVPSAPQCGFSNNVVRILNTYPAVKYTARNVLTDEYVREGIKQFSDWPTLPQLFVKGEFVGGSDIVSNMYKSGELDKLLGATPNKV